MTTVLEKDTIQIIPSFSATHTFTVFPEDLNYAGTLFGGKILAEMDLAATNTARKLLYNTSCDTAVTASLSLVNFQKPSYLGDIIEMTCNVTRLGRTSIEIHVQVIKESKRGKTDKICEATFTFVSIRDGKPHPHFCKLSDALKN
jgi:acyl-CoA thioesterase YciA